MRLALLCASASLAVCAASSAAACDASSFPADLSGLECFGLSPALAAAAAASADACAAACCALGPAACAVWQWCPPGAACQPQAWPCWLGQPVQPGGDGGVCSPKAGWLGGLRATAPQEGTYYAIVPVEAATGRPLPSAARHCDSVVSADAYVQGNPDFEWKAVEALDGDATATSFQPYNYFFDVLGIATPPIPRNPFDAMSLASVAAGAPAADLSWRVIPGVSNAGFFSLATKSAKPQYAGAVLTLASPATVPCAYNQPRGDLTLAAPGAAYSAVATAAAKPHSPGAAAYGTL